MTRNRHVAQTGSGENSAGTEPESGHTTRRERRYRATRSVTILGAVVNTALALMQIVAGWLFHSAALLADGVHTLSDLLSDAVVLVASRQARAGPDANHPYGHGRIETLATTVVALALLGAAGWIGVDAAGRVLTAGAATALSPWVLLFAAVTLVAKETLYRVTFVVAKRVDSSLLRANAWHHRSDAASSLVVLVGLAFATLGVPMMDAIAALAVAGFIAWIAGNLLWTATRKLIDTGLNTDEVAAIAATGAATGGVCGIHDLRTRWIGDDVAADLHVQVAATISVSEGHAIGNKVAAAIRRRHPRVIDVTVHIDTQVDGPADSGQGAPLWPDRSEYRLWLEHAWQALPETPEIDDLTLHFLDRRARVGITLVIGDGAPPTRDALLSLEDRLRAALNLVPPPGNHPTEIEFRHRVLATLL